MPDPADKRSRVRVAPGNRLVGIAALTLLPVALAELIDEQAVWLFGLIALVLILVAVIDAALGLGRAGGVSATMKPLTRVSLGRRCDLEIKLTMDRFPGGHLRIALDCPRLLGAVSSSVPLKPEVGASSLRIPWPVVPRRRGLYRLEDAYVEVPSPLALWAIRWRVALSGEVRVYPNLRAETRVAALFLRRSSAGWRSQRQVGRGRDFEKLREYLPGDGLDEIHWKATAKRGHPVTKVFQIERTQEVYAMIDASRLSARGTPAVAAAAGDGGCDNTLLERQINAALAVALAAEYQGDLFGLMTFADRPRSFVRAKSGSAHFQTCREAVVRLQPEAVSPDFHEACTFLRTRLTKRALIVVFTSLDDPALAEAFVEASELLARRHVVLVATPLPVDARPLFSGDAPNTVDEAVARLAGHERWQGLQTLRTRLQHHGVQLALLVRDEIAAGVVSRYAGMKQQQLI